MSGPNKSLDKGKRYAGVKTNDFVNKTRANEANRSAVRPQGWANLGKINSRRIPPPANLPSLKSEIGVSSPTFDPTTTPNHGWTSNESQTVPNNSVPNPTQQQLDALPVDSPTPSPSADVEKSRALPSWSTVTAGVNSTEPRPNLLGLNDFPRLATTPDRKPQSESVSNVPNPTFRPANLATWKEGGGSRVQPSHNDLSQVIPNNPGANFYQQQMSNSNMRIYQPQMWAYNPYSAVPLSMQQQQHLNTLNDYKTPTILRNKDIDDLSKLTDNTWATVSHEVNYQEKIRFSDDEDDDQRRVEKSFDANNKPRRMNTQVLQHPRLIQEDKHLKQMQENKNSELINVLTIAKQRRDEQERHLRNEQFLSNTDEQKQIPGYQTRPLISSNDQENYNSSFPNTSRTRHDTANSQSSFTMRSWSDQMESFNYASLHETSGGHAETDEPSVPSKYNLSGSESSFQSQPENESMSRKPKTILLPSKKQQQQQQQQQPKANLAQTNSPAVKKPTKLESTDYYDSQQVSFNDQWENWEDTVDNRHQQYANDTHSRRQQLHSEELSTQRSPRFNKQPLMKTRTNDQQSINSRSKPTSSLFNKANQSTNNKSQPAWRPLSPNRPSDSMNPAPQEPTLYKSQQRTNVNDHKQRYQAGNVSMIDTASIPPLMSVRSDAAATAKLYKTANHTNPAHYEDETGYYDPNSQANQRYHHNRGYTALGSYGRYRRSGAVRHQQPYTSYHMNNTSGVSSAPPTSTGTRQKKTSTLRANTSGKKTNQSTEHIKSLLEEEIPSPSIKKQPAVVETPVETSVVSPSHEVLPSESEKPKESGGNGISDVKTAIASNPVGEQKDNESSKTIKKNPASTVPSSNSKRRTNKDQQNYQQDQRYQNQRAPRHRNNYNTQSMQEYEAMQMGNTHNYYGTSRRTTHSGRNTHMHDLSSNYYYEQPQQLYNNRYNYSNESYQSQHRPMNKNSKRVHDSSKINPRQSKPQLSNGSHNKNNNNFRHHSTSDNDQKEGEEWETASESSTNMRNGGYPEINQQPNENKSMSNRGRTPPKKSFSNQRPNARQIFKYTNA